MKIAITGSTGFIGRAVTTALVDRGDRAVGASRDRASQAELHWHPSRGFDPPDALSGFDAVIHLAGESIASGRWTEERKASILRSRVEGTASIIRGLREAEPRPRVFICASAIGYYGDRGNEPLPEDSEPGSGFLADVVGAWENEAKRAEDLPGLRVVRLRFGLVIGRGGGALPRMLPAFRLGVGGRLGDGHQYMSWVHIDDVVGATLHVLDRDDAFGAFNVTAPNPVTNRAFTRSLGRVLHRPTVLPVPSAALKAVFGEMGQALLLESQRAVPERLTRLGYRFQFAELGPALEDLFA